MVSYGIYAILLTQMLDSFVNSAVGPTIPYYMMLVLNDTSAIHLSFLGTVGGIAAMVSSPICGLLSDRYGRKRVLLAALLLQALCNLFQSTSTSVLRLVISRGLVGLAMGSGPVEMAYILDYIDSDEELNHVLAVQKIICSVGSLAGPAVGRFFTPDQFPVLCYALVAINLINFVLGALLWEDRTFDEPEANPEDEEQHDTFVVQKGMSGGTLSETGPSVGELAGALPATPERHSLFQDRTILTLLLLSVVNTFAFGISDSSATLYFHEHFGFNQQTQCDYEMTKNIASLFWTPFVPRFIACLGDTMTCVVAALCSSAVVVNLVVLVGTEWVPFAHATLTVGLFGTMIGFGYLNVLQRKCPKDMMGTFFGFSNSMNGAGGTLAPSAGGVIYQFNHYVPYVITSVTYIIVAMVYSTMPAEVKHPEAVHEELAAPLVEQVPVSKMRKSASAASFKQSSLTRPQPFGLGASLLSHDLELYAAHKELDLPQKNEHNVKRAASHAGPMYLQKRTFSFQGLADVGHRSSSTGDFGRLGGNRSRLGASSAAPAVPATVRGGSSTRNRLLN
eukprot:TRINITY_DN11849_c0_g2_i1.p1 TRINITY_DN11849_c0_g2~~TRINITY_DN11849_c0_g2_i1.p1  ORF type:complete len:563 (+),score=119.46 TRINITY_DN11849_c0_g2_i1:60-1748(+)